MLTHISPLLILGLVGLLGFVCQWLSDVLKLPAILFLLLVGILLGPVLSVFEPDVVFGDLLFPFITLSVAVILFEGALTLSRDELKEIGQPVLNMVTFGILINATITTLAAHYIVGFEWELAALFGAIMVVTGPTVIMPMLRTVRPHPRIGDALRWEGIVIDPIGALFAVLIYEFIVAQLTNSGWSDILLVFGSTILVGTLIGIVAGYLFGRLLRAHLIPENLQNFAALAWVCFAFAISDSIEHESGLLAVTLMGVVLANMKEVDIKSILGFKEDLTLVLVSTLFIVLAARIEFSGFVLLGWGSVLLLLAMQFVGRPLKVFASFIGSDFSMKERAMVAWIGPRGIVAAAVVSVFSLRLEDLGFSQAPLLVPLAFTVIIGTVVIQSLSARPIANLLGVGQPDSEGVLLVGSNAFSIALANAFDRTGITVLVCDTNWDKLRQAREIGLPTYHGNPSSNHAKKYLNINPYTVMLGLSNHYEYNALQATRFKEDFGGRNVYVLPSPHMGGNSYKNVASEEFSPRVILGNELHSFKLREIVKRGGKIKVTRLSDNYTLEKWQQANTDALPICSISANGKLTFNAASVEFEAEPPCQLFYLTNAT